MKYIGAWSTEDTEIAGTVDPDDLTGRNQCPLHKRITGIWALGSQAARCYFMAGVNLVRIEYDKKRVANAQKKREAQNAAE